MTMRPVFRALIPAGILAALVLFVFSTLQYYGPESAVWRFHEGIKQQDQELVDSVTVAATSRNELQEIVTIEALLAQGLQRGYKPRMKILERTPDEVVVNVQYSRRPRNYPFVAQRTSSGWKVNIHKTWIKWNEIVPRSQVTGQRIK